MARSLMEEMPERIAELEAEFGSDNPFVKQLKSQYRGMQYAQDQSAETVYLMQGRQFPPEDQEQDTDGAEKDS